GYGCNSCYFKFYCSIDSIYRRENSKSRRSALRGGDDMSEQNKERLYGWAHPDDIRAYRQKHKTMLKKDKRTTLSNAIQKGVKNDDYLVLGGLGSVRNPMAAGYERSEEHTS